MMDKASGKEDIIEKATVFLPKRGKYIRKQVQFLL